MTDNIPGYWQVRYFEVRISLEREIYFQLLLFVFDRLSYIFSFLIVSGPPACHVFEFTIQVMLSIAFNSASIIWNVTPIASTMTMKAEFVGGPTVLRC